MDKKMRIICLLLISLSVLGMVSAAEPTYVVSNSENWKDVYSTMLYSTLKGISSDFLVSTAHGPLLVDGINPNNNMLIVSSKNDPFVFDYSDSFESAGFFSVEEIKVSNANLELIDELSSIKNFIIVGDDYGYNAIAVTTYAALTNSWVFLADKSNVDEIDSILSRKNVGELLLYGYVDTDVTETLSKYNPEIINTGDKFEDNIEITEKCFELSDTKQVILTNGEFIEKEIVNGKNPILFTGRENVPDQIADYIKDSDIEIGVLIGNELIGAATNIRRSTGISVMVKFARGPRSKITGGVSAVEGLDLFYLPVPILDLTIHSVKYNKATSQLELTYGSGSNVPTYFKGTVTLTSDLGKTKVGDIDPIFIAPGDFKTITYEDISFGEDTLYADIFTLYGETASSLDRTLEESYEVGVIDVLDSCELEIESVKYNKQAQGFLVKTKNLESVDCWASIEFQDFLINGVEQTIGTENPTVLKAKQSKNILLEYSVDDADLEDNSFVDLTAYYGERKESLVNLFKGRFELGFQRFTTLTYLILISILIILILIILMIILKKKDEIFD